jgi:predicted amidohydrolase YtcJ
VTDATPTNGPDEWARFEEAQATGELPQHIVAMGRLSLSECTMTGGGSGGACGPSRRVGPHKILLDEPALPDLASLGLAIRKAHEQGRPVAIHTVTRAELLFALAAFDEVGAGMGDRLEHASVAPEDAMERIRALGLTVVTQPGFVFERGDAYRRDVEAIDQPHLYRLRSWLDRGIPLAGGTDAPFGDPDPWRAIRAAVDRRTRDGATLGPGEALSPEAALGLFLPPIAAAARAREGVAPAPAVGDAADLCLLALPWTAFRRSPAAEAVVATLRAGQPIHP